MIRRAWARWVACWAGEEAPTALALVRIGVAACLLFDLLWVAGYGLSGVIWAPPELGGIAGGATGPHAPLAVALLGAHAGLILFPTAIVLATALLVGLSTRTSALLLALTLAQLGHLAPDSDRGIDFALRIVTALLACSGAGGCWSVDAWLRARRGRPACTLVAAWPRRLIALQLLWIYFSAGQAKLNPTWLPEGGFSALGLTLADPHFARFGPGWVGMIYPLTQAATALTLAFELGAPLLLLAAWARGRAATGGSGWLVRTVTRVPVRGAWVALAITFHLGIAVTLRLGIFPFGMLALYPALYAPDELARALAGARGWARRVRRDAAGGATT